MHHDELLELLGNELTLERIPSEEREKTLSLLGEKIMKQIVIDVYQYIPEAGLKEMESKVDTDDVEGLIEYIETHVPQAGAIMQESSKKVIRDFKQAFGV